MFYKILYYYYFSFYKQVLKDDEPHMLTTLALSFSLSVLLIAPLELFSVYKFCYDLPVWLQGLIILLIVGCTYLSIHRNGESQRIISLEPKLFNSSTLSAIVTFIFFIATLSYFFWGPIITRDMLDNCR
jgi:hypothetical protein